MLLKEGERSENAYFILKGCLRFFLYNKGRGKNNGILYRVARALHLIASSITNVQNSYENAGVVQAP
jgi:hypothetical protein